MFPVMLAINTVLGHPITTYCSSFSIMAFHKICDVYCCGIYTVSLVASNTIQSFISLLTVSDFVSILPLVLKENFL